MAEREHKRGHTGSKARREELTMNKRKSPVGEHEGQEEEPVKGPEGEKTFRVS
jgi:hypothetical protein